MRSFSGGTMILSGSKIREEINKSIFITPFDENKMNSNSYYLTLADHLYIYNEETLDMKNDYKDSMTRIDIPDEGLVLNPGKLYLGSTVERTHTTKYIPIIEGRSSTARLGLFVHVSAGLGEAGFDGHWTLELSCVQPLRIYSGIPICHIYYNVIDGYADQCKNTKYQNSTDAEPSKILEDIRGKLNA